MNVDCSSDSNNDVGCDKFQINDNYGYHFGNDITEDGASKLPVAPSSPIPQQQQQQQQEQQEEEQLMIEPPKIDKVDVHHPILSYNNNNNNDGDDVGVDDSKQSKMNSILGVDNDTEIVCDCTACLYQNKRYNNNQYHHGPNSTTIINKTMVLLLCPLWDYGCQKCANIAAAASASAAATAAAEKNKVTTTATITATTTMTATTTTTTTTNTATALLSHPEKPNAPLHLPNNYRRTGRVASGDVSTTTDDTTYCLFDCCSYNDQSVKDQRAMELQEILCRSSSSSSSSNNNNNNNNNNNKNAGATIGCNDPLPVGTIVYCSWHINGQKSCGKIHKVNTIQKQNNQSSRNHVPQQRRPQQPPSTDNTNQDNNSHVSSDYVYTVYFYDGRIRDNISRKDLITNKWECDIWNEIIRLLHGELMYANNVQIFDEQYTILTNDNQGRGRGRGRKNNNNKKVPLSLDDDTTTGTSSVLSSVNTIASSLDNRGNNHRPKKRIRTTIKRNEQSLEMLFRQCCMSCTLCRMPDCGICEACISNSMSSSRYRKNCIVKICERVPIRDKLQPAIHGWYYYFNPLHQVSTTSVSSSYRKVHRTYQRLRLVQSIGLDQELRKKSNPKSYSIHSFAQVCASDKQRVELGQHLEALVGRSIDEPIQHKLVSMGYVREWLNVDGKPKTLIGTIANCRQNLINRLAPTFTIKYHTEIAGTVDTIQSLDNANTSPCVSEEIVSESMAWGGYIRFQSRLTLTSSNKVSRLPKQTSVPFMLKWMVPDNRYNLREGSSRFQLIEFQDSLLKLEAKPSSIPGAGTGLWIKVVNATTLTLHPGEMLDLGVYAPLQDSDVKTKHIMLVKNLIYNWAIDKWTFATQTKSTMLYAFDPTDDCTGARHDAAQQNLISFANEIASNDDVANISAQYDPEGKIHYLLGHWEETEGPLSIPGDGTKLELLIDYGNTYERCRLRSGYSREKYSLQDETCIKSEDDAATLADVSDFSYNQLKDCLDFLEALYPAGFRNFTESNHARALLAVFALEDRFHSIIQEFDDFNFALNEYCDAGVGTMITTVTSERINKIVTIVMQQIRARRFESVVLSMELLRRATLKRLKISQWDHSISARYRESLIQSYSCPDRTRFI